MFLSQLGIAPRNVNVLETTAFDAGGVVTGGTLADVRGDRRVLDSGVTSDGRAWVVTARDVFGEGERGWVLGGLPAVARNERRRDLVDFVDCRRHILSLWTPSRCSSKSAWPCARSASRRS